MDPELYNKCEQDYEQSCLNQQHELEERKHRWEVLQQAAKAHFASTSSNHIDSNSHQGTAMHIDSASLVNVPERIPEEPERQQDDTDMSVDGLVNSVTSPRPA